MLVNGDGGKTGIFSHLHRAARLFAHSYRLIYSQVSVNPSMVINHENAIRFCHIKPVSQSANECWLWYSQSYRILAIPTYVLNSVSLHLSFFLVVEFISSFLTKISIEVKSCGKDLLINSQSLTATSIKTVHGRCHSSVSMQRARFATMFVAA